MKFTKKKAAAALGVVALLGGGYSAYAYFTGSAGSGSNRANVGQASAWTVSVGAFAGNAYPGAGSSVATYTVTNPGSGNQALTGVSASVNASGGNITESGTPVAGCTAAWFSAVAGAPASGLNTAIAPGANTTGSVTVTMSESGTNQNACQNKTPDITVTAS